MFHKYKHKQCLKHIAVLEQNLGIWPPWELVARLGWDSYGELDVWFEQPNSEEIMKPIVANSILKNYEWR